MHLYVDIIHKLYILYLDTRVPKLGVRNLGKLRPEKQQSNQKLATVSAEHASLEIPELLGVSIRIIPTHENNILLFFNIYILACWDVIAVYECFSWEY